MKMPREGRIFIFVTYLGPVIVDVALEDFESGSGPMPAALPIERTPRGALEVRVRNNEKGRRRKAGYANLSCAYLLSLETRGYPRDGGRVRRLRVEGALEPRDVRQTTHIQHRKIALDKSHYGQEVGEK
jgi:hypothetical protein